MLAAATLLGTGSVRAALPVLLDLMMAAGLLRPAGADSWSALGSAALVVAIRKLAASALTRPVSLPPVAAKGLNALWARRRPGSTP